MSDENLYLEATKWDVMGKIQSLFNDGTFKLRSDYQIAHNHSSPDRNLTWLFTRQSDRHCLVYHKVVFGVYNMIHSRCFQCWKIVAAPRNLSELIKLFRLQRRLDFPSKCGIEGHRLNSNKLYAGYWYNNSIEEGKERFAIIRKAIDEEISPDMPLILKRACTEFEQQMGPSDEWTMAPGQEELEHIWNEVFLQDVMSLQNTKHFEMHVLKKWIHHAYEHGDESYREFTGGGSLFRDLKTYHEEE